jgi:hypothetical protein
VCSIGCSLHFISVPYTYVYTIIQHPIVTYQTHNTPSHNDITPNLNTHVLSYSHDTPFQNNKTRNIMFFSFPGKDESFAFQQASKQY